MEEMNVLDLFLGLSTRYNHLELEKSVLEYKVTSLEKDNAKLLEENEALKKKIDELEF